MQLIHSAARNYFVQRALKHAGRLRSNHAPSRMQNAIRADAPDQECRRPREFSLERVSLVSGQRAVALLARETRSILRVVQPNRARLDPTITLPAAKVAFTLAKKMLGFRYLMNVIPLDASLIKGSHGRPTDRQEDGPVLISSEHGCDGEPIASTTVRDIILQHLFE